MKKSHLPLFILLLLLHFNLIAQVGINEDQSEPDVSAMLDVSSTDSGLLVPRMTADQRTAISTPATGLLVFQTDSPNGFYYYTGSGWIQLSTSPVKELADVDLNTKVQVEKNPNENHIRFDVNGHEAMILVKTGKLGIATSNPEAKLEIAKVATSADEDALRIGVDGEHTANINFFDDDDEANDHFKISYDAAAEKMDFSSSKAGILDLTGRAAVAGSYNTPGTALGAYVSGKYAYVADYDAGLQIIDISDPANPALTGTYNTAGFAYGVSISGKYAFVADKSSGLQVIDISDPVNPVLEGTCNTPGFAYGVYVSGKYAFIADGDSGLQVIDISDPANPVLQGTYNTPGFAYGVYVSGKYAFIADETSNLQIIDISDPANPALTGTYNTSGASFSVYISGKQAFIADEDSGLQIIDISDPANPALIGTYNTSGFAQGVYVSGNYAFIADGDSGLQVIDISDPANPVLTTTYNTPGYAYGLYISGQYVFVADFDSGLQIFELFGLQTPAIQTGNISSNNMTITENLDIRNNLYIGNALNVGPGGIQSDGPVALGNMVSVTTKKIQAVDADGLKIYDEGGKGIFIQDQGRVGVHTLNPTVILQVDGGSDASLSTGGYIMTNAANTTNLILDDNEIMARDNGAASQLLLNTEGGTVSINGTSTSYSLFCNGDAAKPGGGSWSTSSDLQLKDLNGSFERATDALLNINPIRYQYKKNNALGLPSTRQYIGLIAQEVQAYIPEAVGVDNEGYLTVNNDPIIWTMLNAIREQHAMIQVQQDKIGSLEQKIEALEKLLE